jgi:hypothetical protein
MWRLLRPVTASALLWGALLLWVLACFGILVALYFAEKQLGSDLHYGMIPIRSGAEGRG